MDLKALEKDLKVYLKSQGYDLYHIGYDKVENEWVLHVEIDAHLDLEAIAEVSRLLSDYLDTKDYLDDAYLLDVSTVGLERVLYTLADVEKAKGEYVFVRFKKAIDGLKEVYGYLDLDGEDIRLVYYDKNIKKELHVKYDDIRFIRLAVDFKGVGK